MIMLKTFERTPNLAELKVSYRRGQGRGRNSNQLAMPFVVSNPVSAEKYLRTLWDKDTMELREEFVLVCVNTVNEVLGWVKLATGAVDATLVDPRLVFGVALQVAAAGILVAHNHPSGQAWPSEPDRVMTQKLKDGAELLRLNFLDHIILGRDAAFSFARDGLFND